MAGVVPNLQRHPWRVTHGVSRSERPHASWHIHVAVVDVSFGRHELLTTRLGGVEGKDSYHGGFKIMVGLG